MSIEERIKRLEEKIHAIEARHALEDEEVSRIKAALVQTAKKGVEDLFLKQAK